ncbi:ABC transporter ATP-binding protein, partial [Candidatus Woesearchaeota archaeon]|nr:ABC transporter ATP-binding protein [Candidatus Woesearchaeota archaeon]
MLLDEPTVGLDVEIALKVRDLILSLKKKGKTILFTSHNLLEVEQLCDRIALINKGKILAIGTIPEIKRMLNAKLVVEIKCQHPSAAKKAIGSLGKIRNEEQYVLVVELKKENPKELLDRLIDADVGLESYRVLEP